MPEQCKTEESLVHDVERKIVSSSPATDEVFLAIFLRILVSLLIMTKMTNAFSILVCKYHCNVADCN